MPVVATTRSPSNDPAASTDGDWVGEMKKKSRGSKAVRPQTKGAAEPKRASSAAARKLTRRETFRRVRDWGLIALVVGTGTWWLVDDVRADIREHDLTRIGAGAPVVVQIHDPQCPTCRALQREVRAALKAFDTGAIDYVVANIRTDKGRALADAHGVGHVTLLLFDGTGERLQTLSGMRREPALREAFRRHLAKSARRARAAGAEG